MAVVTYPVAQPGSKRSFSPPGHGMWDRRDRPAAPACNKNQNFLLKNVKLSGANQDLVGWSNTWDFA